MFRHLRVKRQPDKVVPDDAELAAERLLRDAASPVTLRQLNGLPANAARRIYRALLPSPLLSQFGIDPITWKGRDEVEHVRLKADPESGAVHLSAKKDVDAPDAFITLEILDNAFNGVDLHLLLLGDPAGPHFRTDVDEENRPTLYGKARRNLAEEEKAMRAGLAPAQLRASLGASRLVLQHLETFLASLGHRAYFLEPLTYASAWVFERRGFAYVRGHKLMDDIQKEFQPGGRLHQTLDASTPFRQPDQWNTVRGRAWAIHDGVLDAIGAEWDGLRMVKQLGRHAGVETFPGAVY